MSSLEYEDFGYDKDASPLYHPDIITPGLYADPVNKGGLSNLSSGITVLADLDFRTPVTQSFPSTAAGLASLLGDDAATPSYIWDCQEGSGNLVDEITSLALVPSASPLQGQVAVGLDDGETEDDLPEVV